MILYVATGYSIAVNCDFVVVIVYFCFAHALFFLLFVLTATCSVFSIVQKSALSHLAEIIFFMHAKFLWVSSRDKSGATCIAVWPLLQGGSCEAKAFSTSQTWYAVLDNSVNYCNLHNLVSAQCFDAESVLFPDNRRASPHSAVRP